MLPKRISPRYREHDNKKIKTERERAIYSLIYKCKRNIQGRYYNTRDKIEYESNTFKQDYQQIKEEYEYGRKTTIFSHHFIERWSRLSMYLFEISLFCHESLYILLYSLY